MFLLRKSKNGLDYSLKVFLNKMIQARRAVENKAIHQLYKLLKMLICSQICFIKRAENTENLSVNVASTISERFVSKNIIIFTVGLDVLQYIVQDDCILRVTWKTVD